MNIDWLTVVAQIINFLILVWLLKRFLYKPVITAMENRERLIASRLNEAGSREEEAAAQREEYEQRQAALEGEREEILAQARQQGDEERRQHLEQARREIDRQKEKWLSDLHEEQADYLSRLKQESAGAVIRTAERVLGDLSDSSLEASIVGRFILKLADLPEDQKRQLADGAGPLTVTTAFELDPEQHTEVEKVLREIAADRDIIFQHKPGPGCGIEVMGEGAKIGWSIAQYLDDLEQRILAVLREKQPHRHDNGGDDA